MSYLEIYNENIRDLLNPSSGFLELREDTSRNRNIQVTGLSEVVVVSIDEVMGLLHQGNRQRTVEPTGVNKTSSRSHALLSVTVCKASRTATAVRQGRLFMIDLAGSERASHTKVHVPNNVLISAKFNMTYSSHIRYPSEIARTFFLEVTSYQYTAFQITVFSITVKIIYINDINI
jgi:hypothetical protein